MHPKELVDESRRLHATGLTAADVARLMGLPGGPSRIGAGATGVPHAQTRLLAPRVLSVTLRLSARAVPRRRVDRAFPADLPPHDHLRRQLARRPRRGRSSAFRSPADVVGLTTTTDRLHGRAEPLDPLDLLFPQHGPGTKHTRKIALHEWQQRIVDTHPGLFLRGLIHSDGCRMTNWTRRRVAGEMKRYEYPRYFFSNKSLDILALCCAALDRLGVAYRLPRWDQVSVARREAVAALDVWIGPKT